jgi:hypothetical protein
VAKVSDEGLLKELSDLTDRLSEAHNRAQYFSTFDDDASVMVTVAGKRDAGGITRQGKARQNIEDMTRLSDRITEELRARGIPEEQLGDLMIRRAELEQAAERDAAAFRRRQADVTDETGDTSFDFGANVDEPTFREAARSRPREFINWARANYNKTVEARIQDAVERGRARGEIDKGYQSFDDQSAQARAYKERVAKELLEDPLSIDRKKMERLTGAEIEGLKLLVGENAATMEAASRVLNDPRSSPADIEAAADLFDKASSTTDQALGKIVSETAQTARSLGYMRNTAKHSLDPEVWLVQAKRTLGDQPMTDAVMLEIRRLAREAAEACG